jgi:hypothetical protein
MGLEKKPMVQDRSRVIHASQSFTSTALWLWLSIVAAILAMVGSVIGLTQRGIYAGLTSAFLPQALAQDVANLTIASPAMLILAVLALRGSLRAYLLWLGVVTFTVYNYVIYTFAVPFGPLFLLWVAVLGLCLYALIGGIATPEGAAIRASYVRRRPAQVVGWLLIVSGFLFGFLWLSEDIPALLAGSMPQSVTDMALPTNPVHVLDLAFFLPAAITSGWLLLKARPLAYIVAPSMLVFLGLTGVPILITPVVQSMRGQIAARGVVAPIGTLTALVFVVLVWLMTSVRTES